MSGHVQDNAMTERLRWAPGRGVLQLLPAIRGFGEAVRP
jgi:hypothetical protein